MMGAEVAVPPAAAAAAARRSAFFALPANMLVLAAEFLMYSCGRAPNTRRRTSCCSCMPTAHGMTIRVRRGAEIPGMEHAPAAHAFAQMALGQCVAQPCMSANLPAPHASRLLHAASPGKYPQLSAAQQHKLKLLTLVSAADGVRTLGYEVRAQAGL